MNSTLNNSCSDTKLRLYKRPFALTPINISFRAYNLKLLRSVQHRFCFQRRAVRNYVLRLTRKLENGCGITNIAYVTWVQWPWLVTELVTRQQIWIEDVECFVTFRLLCFHTVVDIRSLLQALLCYKENSKSSWTTSKDLFRELFGRSTIGLSREQKKMDVKIWSHFHLLFRD